MKTHCYSTIYKPSFHAIELILAFVLIMLCNTNFHALDAPNVENAKQFFGSIPGKFEKYDVILRPDKIAPEWWAGAPSVIVDGDGIFWLACRMRSAELPRGLRGYEIRILRSEDGIHFTKVHGIKTSDVPMKGFERPALLIDPATKQYKLYACGPWKDGPWSIIRFDDADSPERFDPKTARAVITPIEKKYPRDVIPAEYKDPYILYAEGAYHAYMIGYMRQTERIYHFRSKDGETWEPVGSPYEPVMQLEGWHNFYVRPASILPLGFGYLFFYEGSNVSWYDPVYNMNTGVAFTFDLHHIIDLTPDAPLIRSSTPNQYFMTWRYSCWLEVGDEIWVYAEAAAEDETNEIRLFRVKKS